MHPRFLVTLALTTAINWCAAFPARAQIVASDAQSGQPRTQALVGEARKAYEAAQYDRAVDLLLRATALDPHDQSAQDLLRLASDHEWISTTIAPLTPDILHRPEPPMPKIPKTPEAKARAWLDQNLPNVTADRQPLAKLLDTLRIQTGADFQINWTALKEQNITENTPITLSIKQIPMRQALSTILAIAAGENNPPAEFTIHEGAIAISTHKDLLSPKYISIQIHDIRDMLPPNAGNVRIVPDEMIDSIISTIQATVGPDTWKAADGGPDDAVGSIRESHGRLVVTQTSANQLAVFNLLQQLRETRALHLAIENRFILMTDATFKTLELKLTLPRVAGGASWAVIDNWTLAQLLNKTQAAPDAESLTLPRLRTFNGISGMAALRDSTQYAATNYPKKDGDNKTVPDPQMATFDSGCSVTVKGVASADRLYVVFLDIKAAISRLDKLEPVLAPGLPPEFATQKPIGEILETTFPTMVSVPDGGTLVIVAPAYFKGKTPGSKADKIPGERKLIILVRPNLIIHREIENDLVGAGIDRPAAAPASQPNR